MCTNIPIVSVNFNTAYTIGCTVILIVLSRELCTDLELTESGASHVYDFNPFLKVFLKYVSVHLS